MPDNVSSALNITQVSKTDRKSQPKPREEDGEKKPPSGGDDISPLGPLLGSPNGENETPNQSGEAEASTEKQKTSVQEGENNKSDEKGEGEESDEELQAPASNEEGEASPGEEQAGTLVDSALPAEASFFKQHSTGIIVALCLVIAVLSAVILHLLRGKKKTTQETALIPELQNLKPTDAKAANMNYITEVTFQPDVTAPLKVVRVHNIGKRKNQEDSLGVSDLKDARLCEEKGVLAVVADGMGGLHGGEDVSSIAVLSMLQGFSDRQTSLSPSDELNRLLNSTVQQANEYLQKSVGLKKGGSTLMAVLYKDHAISWISVGDSRTALFRRGRLTDLNKRHVYAAELEVMVRQNKISAQQAATHPDREKLTSYIGMGNLKYVDRSARPMPMNPGDKVILMSDGVFNTLSDTEIEQILGMPIENIGDTLEKAVLAKNNPYQDNFTAVILEIPD